MTPITHKEAADLLGVKVVTIKMATSRGVLTRIPTTSHIQYVIKEQVELFKNRRLSKNALKFEEKEKWEEYNNMTINPSNAYKKQFEKGDTTNKGRDYTFYLTEEKAEAEKELERKLYEEAIKQGKRWREVFIASVANTISTDNPSMEKKSLHGSLA